MTTSIRLDDSQREDDDFTLYRRLTRDICYVFHEFAEYRHIMGDLDYANDYALPYWTLINHVDNSRKDVRFIRSGILILLMAMLHDEFEGSGCWISKHLDTISSALSQFVPEDDDMVRLSDAVLYGVAILRDDSKPDERFEDDSTWAYNAFVRQYFEISAQ